MTKEKKPYHLTEEERTLFREAVRKLREIAVKESDSTASIAPPTDTDEPGILDDATPPEVSGEALIEYRGPGIQNQLFKRLRKGGFKSAAELDLHGYTIDEAKKVLESFILHSSQLGYKCVRVIHGKGHRSATATALLKSHVNNWLPQLHQVLAFCSCQPADGGTGAVYVLLR